MPIDHDHSYKFYDERPENVATAADTKVPGREAVEEEEDENVDVSQKIDNHLYLVQVLDSTVIY